MYFIDFKTNLSPLEIFSLKDIRFIYPKFDRRRLVEWQEKEYILKLRNGWYCFADTPKGETFTYFAANRIYSPSYISLETALSYHNIIPEAVYVTTSVTTNKTISFDTKVGEFRYNSLKHSLYFGYEILMINEKPIKLATSEKAILDFLYLHSEYKSENDFIELRFSLDNISTEKLSGYLSEFKSVILEKKVNKMLKSYDIV